MKTVHVSPPLISAPYPGEASALPWRQYVAVATLALATLIPVMMLTIAGVWAVNAGALPELAAASWSSAFIMWAAAVDGQGWRAALLAASGFALAALAWLSYALSPEFGILATALAGAWLSLATGERLARKLAQAG
ncbi:MAG: hypothetical protein HKO64_04935 [Xanthomonadales bacterium]|nr:hypothetical protein [Xanthomonadales bacterium]NNL94944.1 hypothetical protein [Xanthomonadales bacterium]